MVAIRVDEVGKRYGRGARTIEALRGVSLEVRPGEIYGLLGRNGAGKTTLIKILLDIVRPTRGTTHVLSTPSRDPASRRSVGYLPEDHRFPEYLTAASALHFYGSLSGMPRPVRRKRVDELLSTVELEKARRQKVRTFSKGMKQRLGLAQAIIHDPQVLFLDEPTDGVDPVGRARIRKVMEDLRARGTTIFLNSHLLGEVEQICDRVGILDDGRLVKEGSLEELLRSEPVYRVTTAAPPGSEAIEALRAIAGVIEVGPTELEIRLERPDDVDRVIDLLRARSVGIRSLAVKKASLEEVFLRSLGDRTP